MTGINLQITFARSGSFVSADLEHDYLSLLTPEIRSSIARFRRWQDRQATLFGRVLLLRALQSEDADASAHKFRSLDQGPFGKPFIKGGPEFNISHSGDMVVLAVARNGMVGIDIEKIRPIDAKDFARHLPEVSNLDCREDEYHLDTFYDFWTRKEAVLKGAGAGLSVPLEQVVLSGETAYLKGVRWYLKRIPICVGYCCHVATDRPLKDVSIECVNLHEWGALHHASIQRLRMETDQSQAGFIQ